MTRPQRLNCLSLFHPVSGFSCPAPPLQDATMRAVVYCQSFTKSIRMNGSLMTTDGSTARIGHVKTVTYPCSRPHRQTRTTHYRPLLPRRSRAGRSAMGHLPTDNQRLPRRRPDERTGVDGQAHRSGQSGRSSRAHRDPHARTDPEETSDRHSGVLRPALHQQRTHRGHV